MNDLKIGETGTVNGIEVVCLEIDNDWSNASEDVCGFHECVFRHSVSCDRIACWSEERTDGKNVYFRKLIKNNVLI